MEKFNKNYNNFFITNRRNKKLSCEYYNNNSKYILISSHGFCSDKSWWPIKKLTDIEDGPNVFTFDFSGCWESDDEIITIEKQIDDLADVISYVKENIQNKVIVLLWTSLGWYISLKNYSKEIYSIIWFAPVSDKIKSKHKYIKIKQYTREQEEELKKNGYLIDINWKWRVHKIAKEHFEQRASIDQNDFKKIDCPVLVIHWDKDETVDIENSESLKNINKNVELKVIKNGTHVFRENTETNQKIIVNHIKDFLIQQNIINK